MPSARRRLATLAILMAGRVAVARAAEPARPEGAAEAALGPHDPVAGVAGERAFLRSPGNEIVLFPGFLVQAGGGYFPQTDTLRSGFSLRRARLELAGWLGPWFYFDVQGDFAEATAGSPSVAGHPPTDAYLAFAPAGDLVIVQAGQFDAPFSLENRTRDQYLPFVERSLAVRTAVPYNKDTGLMVHGTDEARSLYYSAGVFNGEGPGPLNADSRVDFIGRASVAPFARTSFELLREVSLGGSLWYGQHVAGRQFLRQTTPGGFVFFDPTWPLQAPPQTLSLFEDGQTLSVGGELNLPIGHQGGLRVEGFLKQQDFIEADVPTDGSTPSPLGHAKLQAISGYLEAWFWLLGDDRLLPRPGFELPYRMGKLVEPTSVHGVMVTARGELLKEDLTSTNTLLADPNLATTRLYAATFGVNYWYGRRVRATVNYVLTFFGGTTENIKATVATTSSPEQELLLLLAMGL
jgi:hypothetical protein